MDTATLEILVSLSRFDDELRECDRQIQAGPGRIERLRARDRQLQSELAGLEQELEAAGSRRRAQEAEAEVIKAKIGEYEQQLFAIRSNTDYQAMLRQIEENRRRMAGCENEALELMEREEELSGRLEAEGQRIGDQIGGNAEEIAELEQRIEEFRGQREARVAEREQAITGLTGDTRRLYDRIHRGKGGVAVVSVAKGACGGCFSNLPPQRVNEARLGDRLVTCETCGRIIVWDEETSAF